MASPRSQGQQVVALELEHSLYDSCCCKDKVQSSQELYYHARVPGQVLRAEVASITCVNTNWGIVAHLIEAWCQRLPGRNPCKHSLDLQPNALSLMAGQGRPG